MAASIDFKNPTLVIVGYWNAAILNEPGWIAKNILDVPDGEEVDLKAVVVGKEVSPNQVAPEKQIWLFDTFGFACNGQRVEIYTRDIENLDPLYAAVGRLAELLPHTPIRAVGVNFDVKVSDDVAALAPSLETGEVLDAIGDLLTLDRTDSINIVNDDLLQIEDLGKQPTVLNLSRKTDFDVAEVKFNYHVNLGSMEMLAGFAEADPVGHWRNHALGVLEGVYGIDELASSYF